MGSGDRCRKDPRRLGRSVRDVPGPVVGGWGAPLADRDAHRPGLGPDLALTLIPLALAQVVQVSHRDPRQPLIARVLE